MSPLRPLGKLIGYVTWDGGMCCAELWSGGVWRVTGAGVQDRCFEAAFAVHYSDWDHHVSMDYGQFILPDLARMMDGSFVFHAPPPSPPGVIH